MPIIAVIPVKSFVLGKQRLANALDPSRRALLVRALADHVATTVVSAGLLPLIVTGDHQVAEWATRAGFPGVADTGEGLDAAAEAGVSWAARADSSWIVIHSDLPLLDVTDLRTLARSLRDGAVIAPSSDGGTSAIGGYGTSTFAFGTSSFHRHLSMFSDSGIVTRTGLLLDVDSPGDLVAAAAHPRGRWIRQLLGGSQNAGAGQNLY